MDRKLRTRDRAVLASSNPAVQAESHGGVARNIAENLAQLGAPVTLMSALGQDAAAASILHHLSNAGVVISHCLSLPESATGTYTAVLDRDGELVIGLADMDICERLDNDYILSQAEALRSAGMLIADLNLGMQSIASLAEFAQQQACPLVLIAVSVPKMRNLPRDLNGATLLILNRDELAAIAGIGEASLRDATQIQHACVNLQKRGLHSIIVTCGADGLYALHDADFKYHPAPPVDVVDVTGAGDALSAGVCWSIWKDGADMDRACAFGQRLAAMTLGSTESVVPMTREKASASLRQ